MKAHPRSKGVFNRSAKRYVSVRKRGQLLETSRQGRPPAPGIIDDYLIDDVLAFPGSRRRLILLQE